MKNVLSSAEELPKNQQLHSNIYSHSDPRTCWKERSGARRARRERSIENSAGFCQMLRAKEKHMTISEQWPIALPVVAVRVARPTDRLEAVVAFYRDGLGLPVIDSFEGHAGYSGVMLGLPGTSYHLEFTHHEAGSDCPAPSKDNLLVLYLSERTAIERLVDRLRTRGYPGVPPENPYWSLERSVTIEDPDGWRVVLMLMETSETLSH